MITLLDCAWIRTKLDTYMNSITENFAIVNPFAGKGHFMLEIFDIHLVAVYIRFSSIEYTRKMRITVFSAKTPYTAEASAPVRCARYYSRPA